MPFDKIPDQRKGAEDLLKTLLANLSALEGIDSRIKGEVVHAVTENYKESHERQNRMEWDERELEVLHRREKVKEKMTAIHSKVVKECRAKFAQQSKLRDAAPGGGGVGSLTMSGLSIHHPLTNLALAKLKQ